MVLARLRMKLETEERLSIGMSSLFHGLLMELIETDLAEKLHSGGLIPILSIWSFLKREIIGWSLPLQKKLWRALSRNLCFLYRNSP